eukprot:3831857-Prymnesium_polylepis.2
MRHGSRARCVAPGLLRGGTAPLHTLRVLCAARGRRRTTARICPESTRGARRAPAPVAHRHTAHEENTRDRADTREGRATPEAKWEAKWGTARAPRYGEPTGASDGAWASGRRGVGTVARWGRGGGLAPPGCSAS